MDAENARSVVDDAFAAFGTPGCRYEPPAGEPITGLTVIRHRKAADRSSGGMMLGRGGLEVADRPQSIVVRAADVEPVDGAVMIIPGGPAGEVRLRIAGDPVEDDIWGWALRCDVSPA